MIPEKEREALMRLTMCARNECVMCKYKDSCDSDVRFEFATKHMNILADALRKTENSSEKPNNSTISKMEHVDKDINVRCKDEPQTADVCTWDGKVGEIEIHNILYEPTYNEDDGSM